MNYETGQALAESDADDEHSLHVVAESDLSLIDDEQSSEALTPTTYGHDRGIDRLQETVIVDWTAEDTADFVASIGLDMYSEAFIENDIVGEALIALQHEDLKAMGITSVGHRLTILKSVYDVKKAQDVPLESDHYVPPTADGEAENSTATLKDIRRLVEDLRLRDERMSLMELDLRRVTEEFRRLREDVLPVIRMAKENQPLPSVNNALSYSHETNTITPSAPTPPSSQSSATGLSRTMSNKRIPIAQPPKSQSPTHHQTTYDRSVDQTLDSTIAAERGIFGSSHLGAMNGGSQSNYASNMPSPTSPHAASVAPTLQSRSFRPDAPQAPSSSSRPSFAESDHGYGRDNKSSGPRRLQTPAPDTPGASSNASVEIFKSFRVSMDDPCWKVLPAALKKYQINAPWDQYALYIVYGDQERCLGMEEKPLILFKQLDKEGKKPMFMLRKTNNAQMDLNAADIPGSAGFPPPAAATTSRGAAAGFDPPGGVI